MELERPPLRVYDHEPFRPTSVALVTHPSGEVGEIWVADGYGQSLVHRYDTRGTWLASIDGAQGHRRFDCPHALFVDGRSQEPNVLIADRGNAQLQVYGADGKFRGRLGAGILDLPSGMAVSEGTLLVAELRGRIACFDEHAGFMGTLGSTDRSWQEPGWPNVEDDGRVDRPLLRPGRFNSPHAVAAGADGSIWVAEWMLGTRLVQLVPIAA